MTTTDTSAAQCKDTSKNPMRVITAIARLANVNLRRLGTISLTRYRLYMTHTNNILVIEKEKSKMNMPICEVSWSERNKNMQ